MSPMAAISTRSSIRRPCSATSPTSTRPTSCAGARSCAPRSTRNTSSSIRKTRRSTAQPHPLDRRADQARGARPQRRVLWRQGARPFALRHRHLLAHGAMGGAGKLKVGDDFIHESIIGTLFRGRVEAAAKVGPIDAIIPSIEGWARMTGYNTIFIDDRDPLAHGFQVADRPDRPWLARAKTLDFLPSPLGAVRAALIALHNKQSCCANSRLRTARSLPNPLARSGRLLLTEIWRGDCRQPQPLVALRSNRIPHASASCRRRERERVRGVRRRRWKYSCSSSSMG
jgi:hypothetical protein